LYKTKIKSGDTRKVDCSAAKRLLVVLTKECIPYALLRPLGPDGGDVDLLVEPGHEVKIINLSQRLGLSLLWERRKLRHCQLCFVNEKLNTIILDLQYEVLFERMRLWSREDILSKADLDDDLRILPQDWQVALLLLHCILDKKTWGRHRLVIQRILEEVLDTPDFIEDKLWCLLIDAFRKPSDGIDKHFRNKVRNILLKKRLMNIFAFYAGPGIILFEQLRWGLSGSGICVALIGVDGTGKTTVSRAAVDFLRDQHIPAIRIYRTQPEEYPFNTHIERTEKRNILRGLGQGLKRALKKQREINYCLKEANVLWLTFIWAIRLFLIIPWHKLRGRWIILDRYLYDMVTLDRDICRQKWFIGLVGRLRYGVSRFIYFQTTPEIIAERKNDNSIQEIERQMLAYGKLERYFTNIVDVSAPGREVARRVINILYMQKGLSNAGSFSLQKRRSVDSKQVDFQVLQEVDPAWWNGLVASSPNGTLFQTTYWMEYVRAASGAVPYYLVWRDGDAVLGLSTLFYEPGRYKLFWRLAAGSPGRVFWRYGPVILNGGLSEWEESLASEALHIAKKHGAWSIYGIFPERTGSARPWLTSGYELKPWAT
jgi:thymidylate kinase